MSRAYTPRAGSLAQKVIDHLTEHGGTLTSGEIAQTFGHAGGVSTLLRKAVEVGLLTAEKISNAFTYSLPEPEAEPAPTDGKLQISFYHDGDVGVVGATITDDGVVFTKDQLVQLFQRVTTPHIVLTASEASAP
jgi:hypothetical protein